MSNETTSVFATDEIFIASIQEILGTEIFGTILKNAGVSSTGAIELNQDFSMDVVSAIWREMIAHFGPDSASGLILRTGRMFFKHQYQHHGEELGLADPSYRILPKPVKIFSGMEKISAFLKKDFFLQSTLTNTETIWQLNIEKCDWLSGEAKEKQVLKCFVIGILQAFLLWISGGKIYPIIEPDAQEQSVDYICINKKYI